MLPAIDTNAPSTSALAPTFLVVVAIGLPLAGSVALTSTRYPLPRFSIAPATNTLIPSRRAISWPMSRVIRPPFPGASSDAIARASVVLNTVT